jgi:transcriptional regulator with XRE-family HTH domain
MAFDRDTFLKKVGRQLEMARKSAGLSQKELGELMEKSQDTISRYEAGSREMGISELHRAADILMIAPSVLLGDSSISPYIEEAEKLTVAALRSAARMTLVRYAQAQIMLTERVAQRMNTISLQSSIVDMEILLSNMRQELLTDVERYMDILVTLYKRFYEVDAGVGFDKDFDVRGLLSWDLRRFIQREERIDPSQTDEADLSSH